MTIPRTSCNLCGKATFATTALAKRARRLIDHRMQIYPGCGGGWHLGHTGGQHSAYRRRKPAPYPSRSASR